MGNYLMQLDPSGTCCNCPNRNNPCSNCTNGGNVGNGTGACCSLNTFVCMNGVTHNACVNSGGIYLGDNSSCMETTCTCCPAYDHYTSVIFSGSVSGSNCGGGEGMAGGTWGKVISPGCSLNTYQFGIDPNCLCSFQAKNCFPFTEVDYVGIDEIGDCSDPNSFFGCVLLAHISCAGTVDFEGSIDGFQCCNSNGNSAASVSRSGPYDTTGGPVDVTLSSDSGDPSVTFRFILSLA